jgi:hypothetical protein
VVDVPERDKGERLVCTPAFDRDVLGFEHSVGPHWFFVLGFVGPAGLTGADSSG